MFFFNTLRPDFTSKLVHVLAFGTPKFYIAPYDKIKHELVNLSSNCDVKSGLSVSYQPEGSISVILGFCPLTEMVTSCSLESIGRVNVSVLAVG